MKKNLLELTVEEFVRLLCGMEKRYTLQMNVYPNRGKEEDLVCGTYRELYGAFIELYAEDMRDENRKKWLDTVKNELFDYNIDLDRLDIYNYLEYKTNGFDGNKTRILRGDMEYYKMIINEERLLFVNKKISEGWKDYKVMEDGLIDYKDACIKLYGYGYDFLYYQAMEVTKSGLNTDIGEEPQQQGKVCDNMNLSDDAKKYFARALKCGYMKQTETGYKWLFGGNKGQVRLGYFCNKVFSTPRPISRLEDLFNVKKLSSSISAADFEAKRDDVKVWRQEMDDMIFF